MNRTLLTAACVALTLSSTGCLRGPFVVPRADDLGPSPSVTTSALRISSGVQSGSMGNQQNVSGQASRLDGSYSPEYSHIRLDSEGAYGWVMASISIRGDLNGPDFAPGTRRTYVNGVAEGAEDTGVSVTACAGDSYPNFNFDEQAPEVDIEILELHDGSRQMDYTLRLSNGTVTEGSVVYAIDSSPTGI